MEDWINEYLKYVFPYNLFDINLKEAFRLKAKHIPNKLYKYTSVNFDENHRSYVLENLNNDIISLTRAKLLNDPFECRINLEMTESYLDSLKLLFIRNLDGIDNRSEEVLEKMRKSSTVEELMKIVESSSCVFSRKEPGTLLKFIKDNFDKLSEQQKDCLINLFENIVFIFSLSESNDSWTMWSHYSNDYKGICIEYDFNEIINEPACNLLCPVIYQKEILDLTDYVTSKEKYPNNLLSMYCAMIKGIDWKSEKEWRVIYLGDTKSEDHIFMKGPKAKAIYLGNRITEENQNKVLEVAKRKGIKVFKMLPVHSSFEIQFEEFNFDV